MRPGTVLVVSGVAVIALAALVSTLAGKDGVPDAAPQPEPPPPAETAPEPIETPPPPREDVPEQPPRGYVIALGGTGIAGILTWSDLDRGCRLTAVRLPNVRGVTAPPDRVCDFDLTAEGEVAPSGAVWGPEGRFAARCREGTVTVFSFGRPVFALGGCAPAWRPDGTLTIAREDGVVAYRLPCTRRTNCTTPLLTPAALTDAARRHSIVPGHRAGEIGRVIVQDLVWVSESRAVAILDFRLRGRLGRLGLQQVVALFEDGAPVEVRTRFEPSLESLELSPRRGYVAAPPDLLLTADGESLGVPARLRDVHAVAWSPDERFVAYATRGTVALYRLEDDGEQTSVLPYPARAGDLDWR